MSELIQKIEISTTIRWKLLAGVSALSLTAYFPTPVCAEDNGHPQVWIEVGGQLDRLGGGQEEFAPHFFDSLTQSEFASPLIVERPTRFSIGEQGTISLQPTGSDWTFAASIRYGRSGGKRFSEQTKALKSRFYLVNKYVTKSLPRYEQTTAQNSETHMIVDFRAGKDVGLGLFDNGTSIISAGVRFAQFSESSHSAVYALDGTQKTKQFQVFGQTVSVPFFSYQHYSASLARRANFRGVGPSLSWDASLPLAKGTSDEQIALDWGLNGALLFGKQKTKVHHKSAGNYYMTGGTSGQFPTHVGGGTRSRSVIVPNLGGFAGLSARYGNAKVSVGYRADFFFDAMDGGLDMRKTYDRNFYGPFATISIGLGG